MTTEAERRRPGLPGLEANPRPTSDTPERGDRRGRLARRWIGIGLAFAVLAGVAWFLAVAEDSVDVTPATAPPPVQPVSVATARRRLEDTTVVAPFSGFVTRRFVSPGQTVNAGDRLLKLVDDSTFELTAEVSRRDWALLQKPLAGRRAGIADHRGVRIAAATIRGGGGFLDETTRQYRVFLEVRRTSAGRVLSGDFVRVILPGITVPAALDIPASALTKEGYVWHVDDADRLQRLTPTVLFRRQDRVVIEAPDGSAAWRVATAPLASFLPGRKVRPETTEN